MHDVAPDHFVLPCSSGSDEMLKLARREEHSPNW